jgi:hypothetical protein
MTDLEVLAAIDRGMRRVWARFPLSDEAISGSVTAADSGEQAGTRASTENSREGAKARRKAQPEG